MADIFCGPCGGMRNASSPCPLEIHPPGCPFAVRAAQAPEVAGVFSRLWDGLTGANKEEGKE